MGENKIPRVFVSYAWGSWDKVEELASRLMSDALMLLLTDGS